MGTMGLVEVLAQLEEKKTPIAPHDVVAALERQFSAELKDQDSAVAMEYFVFRLAEYNDGRRSPWGTYYGPFWVGTLETGEVVENPGREILSSAHIGYWSERAQQSTHPVLKARYAGAAWDLAVLVEGVTRSPSMARLAIDASVEIFRVGSYSHGGIALQKLKRALSLAKSLRDDRLISEVSEAVLEFDAREAKDHLAGLCGAPFDLLLDDKDIQLSETQRESIVSSIRDRLDRVASLSSSAPNMIGVEADIRRLLRHYTRLGDKEAIRHLLSSQSRSIRQLAEAAEPMVGAVWLTDLAGHLQQHGLQDERDGVLNLVRSLDAKARDRMKPFEFGFEVTRADMRRYVASTLGEGSVAQQLSGVASQFILRRGDLEKQVKEHAKKFVHMMFTNAVTDDAGRVVAKVGSVDQDLDGNTFQEGGRHLGMTMPFLRETLHELIHARACTSDDVLAFLYGSPAYSRSEEPLLKLGLDAFINGDWISAVSVLTPRVEAAIRRFIHCGGGVTYKRRQDVFQLKNLDELLRCDEFLAILDGDFSFYLRLLLTDPRGWNIRNQVCHGMLPAPSFSSGVADRILHSLLLVGSLRYVAVEQEAPEGLGHMESENGGP